MDRTHDASSWQASGRQDTSGERRRPRKGGDDATIHVLLIEDNAGDALIASRLLRSAGVGAFRTTEVKTIEDALVAMDTVTPDVVLTDLGLPDASGLDAVLQVRSRHESTPIVVFTGADDKTGTAAIRAGADDYLPKDGLTSAVLARSLRYAIERRKTARVLVSQIREGVLVVADNGVVRFANAAAIDMLGHSEAHLVGRKAPLAEMSDGAEIDVVGAGSEDRTVELSRGDIDWYGERASVWTLHDVTARRRNDELRDRLERSSKLAAMGQLAASVAHEINNALAVVSLNLPALLAMVDRVHAGDTSVENLAHASKLLKDDREAVERMVLILRELQAYARRVPKDFRTCDVNDIVRDAARLVDNQVRHRARLELRLGKTPSIVADATRLSQVLVNLILNAADAVEDLAPGEAWIRLTTRGDGEQVTIEVEDNGHGISEEDLGRIFDAFYTTKARDRGTGLGLSVASDIVREHGGAIRASSAGAGSTFAIELPRTVGATPSAASREMLATDAPVIGARILLVDDDALVRTALARSLKHDVVAVASGAEAVALLEAGEPFDAVVCDLMMPGMDGAEVFENVRRLRPALAKKLLVVSGGALTKRARDFLHRESVRVVAKPTRPSVLQRELSNLLREKD